MRAPPAPFFAAWALLETHVPEPYTRVELKIPDSTGLVQQIDEACQARDVSRSEWLREAAREKLDREKTAEWYVKQHRNNSLVIGE